MWHDCTTFLFGIKLGINYCMANLDANIEVEIEGVSIGAEALVRSKSVLAVRSPTQGSGRALIIVHTLTVVRVTPEAIWTPAAKPSLQYPISLIQLKLRILYTANTNF